MGILQYYYGTHVNIFNLSTNSLNTLRILNLKFNSQHLKDIIFTCFPYYNTHLNVWILSLEDIYQILFVCFSWNNIKSRLKKIKIRGNNMFSSKTMQRRDETRKLDFRKVERGKIWKQIWKQIFKQIRKMHENELWKINPTTIGRKGWFFFIT